MNFSARDEFMRAVKLYADGGIEEASTICSRILAVLPNYSACLQLLGTIEFKRGHYADAERLMRKALAANPDFPELHYSFALVLSEQHKYQEAIHSFRRTILLKPRHAEAHFALGNAHAALGEKKEAKATYEEAIFLRQDYPEALNALGVLLFEQQNFAEAEKCFERALKMRPAFAEALNNLGVTCQALRSFSRAEHYFEQAIALQSTYAAALTNLGNVFKEQHKWIEAIESYDRALKANPDLVEARNNLGLARMHGMFDLDNAELCFKEILEQDSSNVPALTHLGLIYCHRGDFEGGIVCYEQALALQPHYLDALNNLGNARKAIGQFNLAIDAYIQNIATEPSNPESHNNLAMALLTLGRLDDGWREFEWRHKTKHLLPAWREFLQPLWRGEGASGCRLLVHAEQGFGDTLQFCRYVPLVAKRGIDIVLEVQPELVRLMRSLKGVHDVVARGEPLPDFNLQIPMMSLPFVFATKIETIPSDVPYLAAEKTEVDVCRGLVSAYGRGLKVGLAWEGNPRLFSIDLAFANQRRSLDPRLLMPLITVPNVLFFSLQKEGTAMPPEFGLINLMPRCIDFADTAALITNLDLVITVDTSVAHLAAALGKPVWLLNRFDSCWRWLVEREDSPWYPTLKIFRQLSPGEWNNVIERIVQNLRKLEKR